MTKYDILEKNNWDGTLGVSLEAVEKSMDEYAKEMAIGFAPFARIYQQKESMSAREEYKRVGGMFSWIGASYERIYEEYLKTIQ